MYISSRPENVIFGAPKKVYIFTCSANMAENVRFSFIFENAPFSVEKNYSFKDVLFVFRVKGSQDVANLTLVPLYMAYFIQGYIQWS